MSEDLVLIWSGEHQAYWRPNRSGYVQDRLGAGIYTREAAILATHHCGPEKRIRLEQPHPVEVQEGTVLAEMLDAARREERDRCAAIMDEQARLADEDDEVAALAACRIGARKIRNAQTT